MDGSSARVIGIGQPIVGRSVVRYTWRAGLQGPELIWALAFLVPYFAIFLLFVVYPIAYGLWMGSNPALYTQLFSDPIYQETVVNTLIFVVIGVNLRSAPGAGAVGILHAPRVVDQRPADGLHLALGRAGAAHLPVDPLDAERRLGAAQQPDLGRVPCEWSVLARSALARAVVGRHRLCLEMAAVLDRDPARRPDGDPEGPVRGGGNRRGHRARAASRISHGRCWPISISYAPCSGYLFTLGDFTTVYFVSGGGPANSTQVLATLGIRDAFVMSQPRLGVAAVMSAIAGPDPAGDHG